MLLRTKNVTDDQGSDSFEGRTDFRSIKGKRILQTLPRANRVQILGRIDFIPHRGKNMFRILHREEHVSYHTQGRTGFRSHREKKTALIPFRDEQLYKHIQYNPISFRDPGWEIYFLIVPYLRRLYLFISNNYDIKKYHVNVSFKCLG